MPRSLSWLPRLPDILRAVTSSPRTHFDRNDLERFFDLKHRAAQELLQLIGDQTIGRAHLVERSTLLHFLERVQQHGSRNISALIDEIRSENIRKKHRVPKTLITLDYRLADTISLPDSTKLSRGLLEIRFETAQQLAQDMYAVVRFLDTDTFAENYEALSVREDAIKERQDMEALDAELEMMKAERESKNRHLLGEVSP